MVWWLSISDSRPSLKSRKCISLDESTLRWRGLKTLSSRARRRCAQSAPRDTLGRQRPMVDKPLFILVPMMRTDNFVFHHVGVGVRKLGDSIPIFGGLFGYTGRARIVAKRSFSRRKGLSSQR
jgi:hypothetical protein